MLWSPSEVLAFINDDKFSDEINKKQLDRLMPTAPYGGVLIFPSLKEDFILIAENSEIHGPNPLFTIPTLDPNVDLNLLSTQILSADYQGLSNNKLLPGKNAQLLMPDISADTHAAIVYFFLFDTEARGFVRPTCVAYFTSDKNKLLKLTHTIFKVLTHVSALLQHFNISCTIDDLKSLRQLAADSSDTLTSPSENAKCEILQKDIQEILKIVEDYKGNDSYDKLLSSLLSALKHKSNSEKIQNWIADSSPLSSSVSIKNKLSYRSKLHMKDLYHICNKGVVLALYHLYISYQFLKRKYENIAASGSTSAKDNNYLLFGACVKNSNRKCDTSEQNICIMEANKVPAELFLKGEDNFMYLDTTFERLLLQFLNWKSENKCPSNSHSNEHSSESFSSSVEAASNISTNSDYLSCESLEIKDNTQENCGHTVPLMNIWDTLEYFKLENPDVEQIFLKILKLFDNSQGLLFSIFTRSPIIIISTPAQLQEAISFITALSLFIPIKKGESIYIDINRQEPLSLEYFETCVAVNLCLDKHHVVEDFIPVELMPKLCILNLKDCSLTAPRYAGRLLADFDQRLRVLSTDGPAFPVLVGFLSEIEVTISWWHTITSSEIDSSEVSSYVLSKGYTRSDMQIIEKLYRLWKCE